MYHPKEEEEEVTITTQNHLKEILQMESQRTFVHEYTSNSIPCTMFWGFTFIVTSVASRCPIPQDADPSTMNYHF